MIDSHNKIMDGHHGRHCCLWSYKPVHKKTIRTIDGLSDNDISCILNKVTATSGLGQNKRVTVFDGKTFKNTTVKTG